VGGDTCVCIPNPKGQYFRTLGQADRWNRLWLLPEEALYLLERGSLDIRWPVPPSNEEENGDVEEGVPMSVQAAYASLIGRGGLSMERFSVYSGLKRAGYVVVRAPSWDDSVAEEPATVDIGSSTHVAHSQSRRQGLAGLLVRLLNSIYSSQPPCYTALGPVIGLGIHRSYSMSPFFFFWSLLVSSYPLI
jgi:tRNA-splicing endonuclease subunit Sen54